MLHPVSDGLPPLVAVEPGDRKLEAGEWRVLQAAPTYRLLLSAGRYSNIFLSEGKCAAPLDTEAGSVPVEPVVWSALVIPKRCSGREIKRAPSFLVYW